MYVMCVFVFSFILLVTPFENSIFNSIIKYHTPMLLKETVNKFEKHAVNTECVIASQIGQKILDKGGNAVDAAISATIAIGIVNSFSAGIGGGGFLMLKKNDTYKFYDFRETAPKLAKEEYFINHPEDLKFGIRSTCTPGELKGLYTVHKEFGKLPWNQLFDECIELCNTGFKANILLINKLKSNENFIKNDPGFREIFMKHGNIIQEGDIIIRKNLGRTLQEIAQNPDSLYTGQIAEKIVEFSKNNNGFLTKSDLEDYNVKERDVLRGNFKEYDVITTNLPTSGAFVLMALNILDQFDFKNIYQTLSHQNEFYIFHILIEIFKFMFLKRGEAGDPTFVDKSDEKIIELTSKALAHLLFNEIDFEKPLDRKLFGNIVDFAEDHGTTHLNVIDSDGMAVLITTTINLEFGSKVMDPETGIIFNNHMDDFYVPGILNAYNLSLSKSNRIEPGKRPFSSACPTILIKKDDESEELLLLGAAGGTKIPTSIVSTILFYYLTGDLYKAITMPRIHDQLLPKTTFVEDAFPYLLLEKLKLLGHQIVKSDEMHTFTSVNGINVKRTKNHTEITTAADPRKLGGSCGE